ncbi:MAG: SU10 major capsid protein [Bacteroidales bacterium]
MTMLQTFNLKGNKQSFADWISNLSPCETPFISMIGKEKTDQVQYSWQTDALSQPNNTALKEGSAPVPATDYNRGVTAVQTNFTQIFRKAVRVSDTTKKVSLYGRASELAYQMEKAGMEIKRDVEAHILTNRSAPRPGTAGLHGIAAGVQMLVAGATVADPDTTAVVHKVVTYAAGAHIKPFTQVQVFDLTYNLYLAGARANKIMFHPMHMGVFSAWISNNTVTPHAHRMFDGMDNKYNAHVSTIRDPLGQVFDLIPNRYMPKNQLFFFHEGDWTQMVLREPTQTELAKTGSSEKHMIEMEVGLRHRNPFASGILEFNAAAFPYVAKVTATPVSSVAGGDGSVVSALVLGADNAVASGKTVAFTATVENHDGSTEAAVISDVTQTIGTGVATAKVKHNRGARVKVKAKEGTASNFSEMVEGEVNIETYESRD